MDVYFEEENLWLHDERMEMLITVFCALAQSESESMSQNIRWCVRQGFRMGTSGYADFVCYGYKQGDDGRLAIDEPDAENRPQDIPNSGGKEKPWDNIRLAVREQTPFAYRERTLE